MAFTPPQFNVACDVWYFGRTPNGGTPDVDDQPCQFYFTPRGHLSVGGELWQSIIPTCYLRLPFADQVVWHNLSIVEVPPSSGRYYAAVFKDRMHLGFPNQYLFALVVQCDANGINSFHDFPGIPAPGIAVNGAGGVNIQLGAAGTTIEPVTADGGAGVFVALGAAGSASVV